MSQRDMACFVVCSVCILLHLSVKLTNALATGLDSSLCTRELAIPTVGTACFDQTSGDLRIRVDKEIYGNDVTDLSEVPLESTCPLKDEDCPYLQRQRELWQRVAVLPESIEDEQGNYSVTFKNVPDGRYKYRGSSLCLHRSYRRDVTSWNATLILQYDADTKEMSFTMTTMPEMKSFGFSRYLVTLNREKDRIQETLMEFNETGTHMFKNVSQPGQYRAEATPVDCRCKDNNDSTATPCTIHSNAVVVVTQPTPEPLPAKAVSVENILWYTAAAGIFLILLIVAAYYVMRARQTRKVIRSASVESAGTSCELDQVSTTQEVDADIPILFVYSRSSPEVKQKASELRLALQSNLPCIVYDYGDDAQEDELYQEGPHWFTARLHMKGTRVIVIISRALQQMENALLNSLDGSVEQGNLDLLCFSALSQVTGLVETQRNSYSRIFCVKFTGIDDNAECKSLTPLRRFELPQHMTDLIQFLQVQGI